MDDPSAALAALTGTMDDLEAAVAPLLARPLNDTMADLGPLERAKMDVLVAYAINNLVWVYLRARGIEPATHDVSKELERIQTYYGKVKAVENPSTQSRPRIDREAAHRFVKNNLPNSRSLPSLPVRTGDLPSSSAAAIAAAQAVDSENDGYIGRASRFRHVGSGGEKVLPGSGGGEEMEVDGGSSDEADALLEEVDEEIAQGGENTPSGGKRKRWGSVDLD